MAHTSMAGPLAIALLLGGCATAPSGTLPRGISGPVEWEVTDVGQIESTDRQQTRWSYVVVLRETAGARVEFERAERGSYSTGQMTGGTPEAWPFRRTLAANSELRLPFLEFWGWDGPTAQRMAFGGTATIGTLTVERRFIGKDAQGKEVTVLVRLRLDSSVGKLVRPPPMLGPLPPERSLEAGGLASVTGTWRGSYRADNGRYDIPLEITIGADGRFEGAENDPVTVRFRGSVRVDGGKLAYVGGRDTGLFTLHEGDGRRVLAGHVSGTREGQAGAPPSRVGYSVRLSSERRP